MSPNLTKPHVWRCLWRNAYLDRRRSKGDGNTRLKSERNVFSSLHPLAPTFHLRFDLPPRWS